MDRFNCGGIVKNDYGILIGRDDYVSNSVSYDDAIVIKIPMSLINNAEKLCNYISNELSKWISK